jgi:hypothetical protein
VSQVQSFLSFFNLGFHVAGQGAHSFPIGRQCSAAGAGAWASAVVPGGSISLV